MASKIVYTSLSAKNLQELLSCSEKPKVLIRFSAAWWAPCQAIKESCNQEFATLPETIKIADLDIDETIDLYAFLKRKRMVSGIPTLLFYDPSSDEKENGEPWYIASDSVSGTNSTELMNFFNRCREA